MMSKNVCSIEKLEVRHVNTMEYNKVSDSEQWRVTMLAELMNIRHGNINPPDGWSTNELERIIEWICTN